MRHISPSVLPKCSCQFVIMLFKYVLLVGSTSHFDRLLSLHLGFFIKLSLWSFSVANTCYSNIPFYRQFRKIWQTSSILSRNFFLHQNLPFYKSVSYSLGEVFHKFSWHFVKICIFISKHEYVVRWKYFLHVFLKLVQNLISYKLKLYWLYRVV